MSVVIYGIKNCDSVKKARKWFDDKSIPYRFHDFRVDGMSDVNLSIWEKSVGFEKLLNRKGTTFRNLPDTVKHNVSLDTLIENPTLIKRPVVAINGEITVGVDLEHFERLVL